MLTALQIQELVKDSEDYNVDIKHSVPCKEIFGEVAGFTNDAGDHVLIGTDNENQIKDK